MFRPIDLASSMASSMASLKSFEISTSSDLSSSAEEIIWVEEVHVWGVNDSFGILASDRQTKRVPRLQTVEALFCVIGAKNKNEFVLAKEKVSISYDDNEETTRFINIRGNDVSLYSSSCSNKQPLRLNPCSKILPEDFIRGVTNLFARSIRIWCLHI
eukprot:scaffold6826_cov66-Skeletonema_marinoi.AAC.1